MHGSQSFTYIKFPNLASIKPNCSKQRPFHNKCQITFLDPIAIYKMAEKMLRNSPAFQFLATLQI